jgi:integrase
MIWTVTEESARALDLDGRDDRIKFDDKFPRFGVRVRKLTGGNVGRTYVYQYKSRGKTHRMLCGAVGVVSAQDARRIAKGHEITILSNGDPAADRRALRAHDGHTLGAAVEQYLSVMQDKRRKNTLMGLRLDLNERWKKFHTRALDEITAREVSEHLIRLAEEFGPSACNRARSCLSTLYVWARKRHMCITNPTVDTEKAEANGARERALSDPEIAALWQATEGAGEYQQVVRLLLLTGCRAREIAELRWSEVDLEANTVTIAKERSKNGNAHLVPLGAEAAAILRSRRRYAANVFGRGKRGFNSFSASKPALDKTLQFKEGWTLHDLRRTIATGLQRLGVRLEVTEAVLNHTGAARTGVAGVYHLHDYKDEKRAALAAWENHIRGCVAQASGGKVTALALDRHRARIARNESV